MYKTIAEIKAKNKEAGNYWFSEDTMRFFGTKIETGVIYDRYFITSEDNFNRTERFFKVRKADDSGKIDTLFWDNDFETIEDAMTALIESLRGE